jgi:hypothetical protein
MEQMKQLNSKKENHVVHVMEMDEVEKLPVQNVMVMVK